MATFDINLNVTLRVSTPKENALGLEGNFVYPNMIAKGLMDTAADQEYFWKEGVRRHGAMFMYLVLEGRDLVDSEVTVTLIGDP